MKCFNENNAYNSCGDDIDCKVRGYLDDLYTDYPDCNPREIAHIVIRAATAKESEEVIIRAHKQGIAKRHLREKLELIKNNDIDVWIYEILAINEHAVTLKEYATAEEMEVSLNEIIIP